MKFEGMMVFFEWKSRYFIFYGENQGFGREFKWIFFIDYRMGEGIWYQMILC